ncbi:MAG: hypothetical protein K2G03_07235 [Bacilli bacterium]|nr:hypothetical protein [Bacilli bacterium]MDE6142382.1 hypothetical protein [Bacilli bacterium]
MTIDINTLSVNDLTPEIMAQMGPAEIAAFKAKLTPEQIQALADKLGGSQIVPPEMPEEQMAALKGNSNTVVEETTAAQQPVNPTEQRGPVVFGRK